MKTARSMAVALVLALVAAACGAGDSSAGTAFPVDTTAPATVPAVDAALARADVARATTTDVTVDEIATLVAGNAEFAFDLFRRAGEDGQNVLISPYSVAAALTMTYAGARGATAEEMRDVLALGLADERIHAARNQLDLAIGTPPSAVAGDDRDPFRIRIANSLWGQQGFPFLDEFLVLLAENYDAGMNLVDFATAAEEARVTINAWVEEATGGRIPDLIPPGIITDLTRLVLVNAIWFKASWADQFDPAATADGSFHLLDGGEATVPFMHRTGAMAWVDGEHYQAVRLAYAGDAAMLIVVPDPGSFAELATSFGPEMLDRMRTAGQAQVALALPRFEFRSEFALKPALRELGMVDAFSDAADLSGMTGTRDLFLSEVVHQAFITVDEEGTEAAAATAVIAQLRAAPAPMTELTIDRPFLFAIEHTSTGEVLFLGQVTVPG